MHCLNKQKIYLFFSNLSWTDTEQISEVYFRINVVGNFTLIKEARQISFQFGLWRDLHA